MTKGKRRGRAGSIVRVERIVVPDSSTRPLEIHPPVMVERALVLQGQGRGFTSDRVLGPVDDPRRVSIRPYGLPLEVAKVVEAPAPLPQPEPTPTIPEFRSDGTLIGELASFLSRHGFHVALHAEQYLAGRHRKSDNTVFVKVIHRKLLDSSDWLAGFHFAVDSFKHLIEGLDRTWSIQTRALVSGLNPEVLTPFGWHAYYDEPTRHRALERCMMGLGVDHVLNVLKWLRNSWPRHPTHHVHSEAVKRDYLWFDRTFGEKAYPYRRKRRELRTKIESECQRTIAERPDHQNNAWGQKCRSILHRRYLEKRGETLRTRHLP
jgi:hypothetical protein